MNKKITEITVKKLAELENKVDTGLVRIEEQLKAINENLKGIKQQTEKQDNRFWSLVLALFVALFGAVAKV